MAGKTTSMLSGSPVKAIMAFAIPMLVGNVFQQLYNFVDSSIVGKYIGGDALAAVGSTSLITSVLISFAMGLTNGAGIIIAQCFGARDYKTLKQAVTSMVAVLSVMAVIITAAGIALSSSVLRLLNVPNEIIAEAAAYMRVTFAGCVFMIAYNACSAILRNLGNSKVPLCMLIISSLLNVVLDLLFIIVFKMGVVGAGTATVISMAVSAVLCLWYLMRNREKLYINKLPKRVHKNMVSKIFKTGLPAAMQSCFISLGGMLVQGLINSFGTGAMAAYTASTKIDSLTIQVIVSLAAALSVFSGQNAGARRYERIKKGLYQMLAVMAPICIALAVLLLLFRRNVIGLLLDYNEDAEAIEIACKYLSVIGIGYIIAGIMQCYQGLLRGAGDVNICVLAGMAELSVRVAASYIFVRIWGIDGIWYAIPFSWGFGCSIPVIRYYSGKWKNKMLV